MSEYPREDKPLVICLADNTRVSGLVNIAGRTTQEVLEDEGTDLVLYEARGGDGIPLKTLFIVKNLILWIAPAGEAEKREESGLLKQVKFKLTNGQIITGRVEISGFERLSDYFHACRQQFYEIRDASVMDKNHATLYVGVEQVLWKEPID